MLSEREEKMIAAYLPHPRDPELGEGEYYVLDSANRVRRVYVTEILPDKENMTFGVRESATGKRIDAGYGSPFIGFRMAQMYDNKQDCRDCTHLLYDNWEKLRKRQKEESNTEVK